MSVTDEPFRALLGDDRGMTDRDASLRLGRAERTVAALEAKVELQRINNETLRALLQAQAEELAEAHSDYERLEDDLRACGRQRDAVRYAAVDAGNPDPLPDEWETHEGTWTPGRSYLSWQHAVDPDTGACYCAGLGGVRADVKPGTSERWERCESGRCPRRALISMKPHPMTWALRQDTLWFCAGHKPWALHDVAEEGDNRLEPLTDEHLEAVIAYLTRAAPQLQQQELQLEQLPTPCPANAYTGAPERWIADTPFMRAALAERASRAGCANHGSDGT